MGVGHGSWMPAWGREYRQRAGVRQVARGNSEEARSPRNHAHFHRLNVYGRLGPRKRSRDAANIASVRCKRPESGRDSPRASGSATNVETTRKKISRPTADLPPRDAILPESCRVIDSSVGSPPFLALRRTPLNFADPPRAWKTAALLGQIEEPAGRHGVVGTSITFAPSGGSKVKVLAGGSVSVRTSASAMRVTLPKRSTTSVAWTRPLFGSTSMVSRS
jgi:hypothetical protein